MTFTLVLFDVNISTETMADILLASRVCSHFGHHILPTLGITFYLLYPQKHAAYAAFGSEKSAAKVIFIIHPVYPLCFSMRRISCHSPLVILLCCRHTLTLTSLSGPEQAPPATDPQSHACCGVCQGPRPHYCVERSTGVRQVSVVY